MADAIAILTEEISRDETAISGAVALTVAVSTTGHATEPEDAMSAMARID
jgi:hypothetical protein